MPLRLGAQEKKSLGLILGARVSYLKCICSKAGLGADGSGQSNCTIFGVIQNDDLCPPVHLYGNFIDRNSADFDAGVQTELAKLVTAHKRAPPTAFQRKPQPC